MGRRDFRDIMICSPVVEVRGLRERVRTSLSFTLAGGENPAGACERRAVAGWEGEKGPLKQLVFRAYLRRRRSSLYLGKGC